MEKWHPRRVKDVRYSAAKFLRSRPQLTQHGGSVGNVTQGIGKLFLECAARDRFEKIPALAAQKGRVKFVHLSVDLRECVHSFCQRCRTLIDAKIFLVRAHAFGEIVGHGDRRLAELFCSGQRMTVRQLIDRIRE